MTVSYMRVSFLNEADRILNQKKKDLEVIQYLLWFIQAKLTAVSFYQF